MRKLLVIIAAGVAWSAAQSRADQTPITPTRDTTNYGVLQTADLTGSQIKTTYRRWDRVQDSPFNLYVIDRRAIRRSGATSVAQLIQHYGSRR